MTVPATASASRVRELHDPARGRRTVWLDDDDLPVRVELADGTTLLIERDQGASTLALREHNGSLLLELSAPAGIDGGRTLVASDPNGVTRTDVSAGSVRLERESAVLRIDADEEGRPRRVTAPGCSDLLVHLVDGSWQLSRLGCGELFRITPAPDGRTVQFGDGQGWVEAASPTGSNVRDLDGRLLVASTFDPAGRVTARRWSGGSRHDYVRDSRGRLVRWVSAGADGARTDTERWYTGDHVSALVQDGRRTVVRSDAAGRVRKLIGPRGTTRYEYDPNGRRIRSVTGSSTTSYGYDPLGQLVVVGRPDGTTVRFGWDGLGRRISVEREGARFLEHRDAAGRLWSVTTDEGAAVCSFIWWDGRVLARCDAAGAIDEVYLADALGTLLGIATADSGWRFTEAIQPPFGAVSRGTGWRPTLFGHIADGETPLVCFGARELDPQTGLFLTPDPWHGELDDPRRLGGETVAAVAADLELPRSGIHPYALSHGDPLSRADLDGHHAVLNGFLTLFLAPTWGAPLTSLSVFLFLPLNIYFEIFGLFGYLGGGHAWPQHSIFGLRGASSSGRLGTVALALNGFFPRATAGLSGDRCITIGHVVWENRHYFTMLDRARVLELDDIGGTPRSDGRPTFDARKLSDSRQGSVLAVISTDGDNRQWVHGTWWTRGPGNAVGDRAGVQSFEDRAAAGAGHARGTVYLAQPMPRRMPTPRRDGDSGRLDVTQYAASGPGTHISNAELVSDVWFAFELAADSGMTTNSVIEIAAGSVTPGYGRILTVVATRKPTAVLDHELPARFQSPASLRNDIRLRLMAASTTSSAGWTARSAGPTARALEKAAPPHAVAVDDVFECAPATPDPATPERPKVYTRVERVITAVQMSPAISSLTLGGASLFRLATDGTPLNGNIPDPAGHPDQFTVTGDNPLVFGDMVAVQPTGSAPPHYGRVTAVAPAVEAVPPAGGAPGTPAVPATLTISPPFTVAAVTAVRITRLKATDRAKDTGSNPVQSGDTLDVDVRSTAIFAVDQPVLIESGADRHVRRVAAIGTIGVDTVDQLTGTGPWTLTKYTGAERTVGSKLSARRFVKHTGRDAPSTYGTWPGALMGLAPVVDPAGTSSYPPERQPAGWRFFLKSAPPPAGLHPDFSDYWEPITVGGASYWLLTGDLKIVREGTTFYWEPDAEDDHPRRHRQEITPNTRGAFPLVVRDFAVTPVRRPDGGGKVFAFPAEAQVPEQPTARWSLADALADHELMHTVQNTYWGPILGALPLQGAFRSVRDVLVATGSDAERTDWMEWSPLAGLPGFQDTNVFELLSLGGLMQLIWSFVILGPALLDEDARNAILSTNFDSWAQVFNPINQQIIRAIPKVDRNAPATRSWENVLGTVLARGLDMRAWTPFMGFIKLLLPDGPRNFLEQQASRVSGDLYSTILTANDRFNAKLAGAADKSAANLTAPLGDAVRLMSFYDGALSRNMELDACDAPGSPLVTLSDSFTWAARADILQFAPIGSSALLPADLYESVSGSTLTTLAVDGPTPTAGGAAPVVNLLKVPAGTTMRPRLRSIVPVPPRVMRALGCYLLPAGPGVWTATAPDRFSHTPDEDAHTAEATITINTTVRLGSEDVNWAEPATTGTVPSGPSAVRLARFVTEQERLTVAARNTTNWVAEAATGSGVTLTRRTGGQGWDLTVSAPSAGAALPSDVRVRIWAKVAKDDAELFDLRHGDVPTLANRRSYVDDDFWLPVRDFLVSITDLPTLPPASMPAAGQFDLDLPVRLAGPASIVQTGSTLSITRVSDRPPRGERWRLTMSGLQAVEAATTLPVKVRFGSGAAIVERPFVLTVTPNFTIDGPSFDATTAAPLTLTVNGGTGPYSVVDQPPSGSRTTVTIAGNTVTVSVGAPPAGAAAVPAVTYRLVLRDNTGQRGLRSLVLHP